VSTAPQIRSKTESEVRNVAVDMRGKLDTGELLTGTPTVIEEDTANLTITNQAINVLPIVIMGQTVPIAQAVQFKVSGGLVGRYSVRVTCDTDSVPAQTLIENLILMVTPD
jgi:hypothetical protein